MKIVLDTNIFISGIFWHGPPHQIIQLAEEKKLKIYSTSEILDELFEVLQRKKFEQYVEEGQTRRQEIFQRISELVNLCQSVDKVEEIAEDLEDNKFLACALACGADFIISGDSHLLNLKEFKGIPILKPQDFLERIKK